MESSAKTHAPASVRWIPDRATERESGSATPSSSSPYDAELQEGGIAGREDPQEMVRRHTNIAMALVGLIVALPLMLLIAILVKVTSRGPVLYTQKRVGHDRRSRRRNGRRPRPRSGRSRRPSAAGISEAEKPCVSGRDLRERDRGGRIFTIYKFRTMYVSSESEQVWARPGDDRVTPVGRVLRKLHLDELPQLFNVLKGDMNVVGPRPEQPEIFDRLARQIPEYRYRQKVRPGITGWAQVHHHYDRSVEDVRRKVELDLEYLHRRSALEDVKITLQTVPAVLTGEDAQGW